MANLVIPCLVKAILAVEIAPLLRALHLHRDLVIGLIGDRGSGKSLGGGAIGLFDYMVREEPCYSNMGIAADVALDDETAAKYKDIGFTRGGIVHYRSKELDMVKFLEGDSDQTDGVYFIDEYNIAVADARRAMSNQNLQAADTEQQLRKNDSALIFTCLSEMFVDNRLRDQTDIFIKTRDTALSIEGVQQRIPQGLHFKWEIYPMTDKGGAILGVVKYSESQHPITNWGIDGKPLWSLIDTLERQHRQKYKVGMTGGQHAESLETVESPAITKFKSKWYFLPEKVIELRSKLEAPKEFTSQEIDQMFGISAHGLSMSEFGSISSGYGVRNTGKRIRPPKGSGFYWVVEPGWDLANTGAEPLVASASAAES